MKLTRFPVLFLAAGLASATTLAPSERAELAAARSPSLEQLRGGASEQHVALRTAERTTLARAQQAAPDLERLRGGDLHLTDHDLKIIAVVVLAILLIAVIA